MTADYPHAGSYPDRHGKQHWRFRRAGKTIQLPGSPGQPEFEAAYAAACLPGVQCKRQQYIACQQRPRRNPFRAAWRILTCDTPDWKALDPETQRTQTLIAERFLRSPVVDGELLTFGDVAVSDLQRRHIKAILAARSDTPHAANHLNPYPQTNWRGARRRMDRLRSNVRFKVRADYRGWTPTIYVIRRAYEARWPLGTTARTVYALALYFGHRRSDVATVKWSDLGVTAGNVVQQKTGKAL